MKIHPTAKYFIILLLFSSTLTGCKYIATVFYGISTPREVTYKKIEKKKNKYCLHYFDHYNITEKGFYSYFDVLSKNNFSTSITRFLIFKDGKLLQPVVEKVCPAEDRKFISNLQDSASYICMDSVFLSGFVNNDNFYDFNSEEFQQKNKDKDFTIILYWATFAGKFNKIITADLAQTIKDCIENKGLNAYVFYVNLDVKEDWKEKDFKTETAGKVK